MPAVAAQEMRIQEEEAADADYVSLGSRALGLGSLDTMQIKRKPADFIVKTKLSS